MKKCNNYETVELNQSEMIETEGGIFGADDLFIAGVVVGAVAGYLIGETIDGVLRYARGERIRH